jgi:hypothetical protein
MGVFDAFKNLAAGSGRTTLPVELAPGEQERGRFVAGKLVGGSSLVGGDLVVTDRRVVFAPLNVTDIAQVLSWGLAKAGAPGHLAQAPIKLGELVGQPSDAGLLMTAEAGRSGSPIRPPQVILKDADGNESTFGVVASRTSPNWARANIAARDELIALVNEGR